MSFFSSFVGINSAMSIAKIILLVGLLLLSITSPTGQAMSLCHLDPTKSDEFPGVIRFPIPRDSDSIPQEFRALVGTEFARPKNHLYPTVRLCSGSIFVINRTSPLSPFRSYPYPDELHPANEVHQFLGYSFFSAERRFRTEFNRLPRIPVREPPKVRTYDFPKVVPIHNNVFEDFQSQKFGITSSLKIGHELDTFGGLHVRRSVRLVPHRSSKPLKLG